LGWDFYWLNISRSIYRPTIAESRHVNHIVTCPLKARIVGPEETAVAREWLGDHAFAVRHTHATIEGLLEAMFSILSVPWIYKDARWSKKKKKTRL
jgi:hypothetical protein